MKQTLKEQTKMPRCMLEGPRPYTIIILFCIHILHELCNQNISIGQFLGP